MSPCKPQNDLPISTYGQFSVGSLKKKRLLLTSLAIEHGNSKCSASEIRSFGWWSIDEYVVTGPFKLGPREYSWVWLRSDDHKLVIKCKPARIESGTALFGGKELSERDLYVNLRQWIWVKIGISLMAGVLRRISVGESVTVAGLEFSKAGIRRLSRVTGKSKKQPWDNLDPPSMGLQGFMVVNFKKKLTTWPLNPRKLDNAPLASALLNFLANPSNQRRFMLSEFSMITADDLKQLDDSWPVY